MSATEQIRQSTRGFNAIFIHSSLDDAGLTPQQFRLFAHLSRRAGEDGCFSSVDNMAEVCKMHPDTVRECQKVLLEKCMIRKHERPGRTTIWEICQPKEWLISTPPSKSNPSLQARPHPPETEGGHPPENYGDEGNPSKGNPIKDSAKAVKSPVKQFESKWCEEYPKHHDGVKYLHGGAKDTKATKRMLSAFSPAELIAIAIRAWKNPNGFNCKQAATICGMASRLNDIQQELNAPAQQQYSRPKSAYERSMPSSGNSAYENSYPKCT